MYHDPGGSGMVIVFIPLKGYKRCVVSDKNKFDSDETAPNIMPLNYHDINTSSAINFVMKC